MANHWWAAVPCVPTSTYWFNGDPCWGPGNILGWCSSTTISATNSSTAAASYWSSLSTSGVPLAIKKMLKVTSYCSTSATPAHPSSEISASPAPLMSLRVSCWPNQPSWLAVSSAESTGHLSTTAPPSKTHIVKSSLGAIPTSQEDTPKLEDVASHIPLYLILLLTLTAISNNLSVVARPSTRPWKLLLLSQSPMPSGATTFCPLTASPILERISSSLAQGKPSILPWDGILHKLPYVMMPF